MGVPQGYLIKDVIGLSACNVPLLLVKKLVSCLLDKNKMNLNYIKLYFIEHITNLYNIKVIQIISIFFTEKRRK